MKKVARVCKTCIFLIKLKKLITFTKWAPLDPRSSNIVKCNSKNMQFVYL